MNGNLKPVGWEKFTWVIATWAKAHHRSIQVRMLYGGKHFTLVLLETPRVHQP
jgi:hypothetical protein